MKKNRKVVIVDGTKGMVHTAFPPDWGKGTQGVEPEVTTMISVDEEGRPHGATTHGLAPSSATQLTPLLASAPDDDRSVLVGAPPDFDLLSRLRGATTVRIAMAFGHMSGWTRIESAVEKSTANSIHILLGRSFFQTEPEVLRRFRKLQKESSKPAVELKLASAVATFHPKVWIIEQEPALDAFFYDHKDWRKPAR